VGIELDDRTSWALTAFAGVEAGAGFTLGESFKLRPYIRSGLQVQNVDEISVDLSLIGSPESAGSFRSYVGFDQVVGEVGAGLTAESSRDFSAQLGYDGAFGSTSTQHQATVRLELKF
jgi:outer membrane autotransporter protein